MSYRRLELMKPGRGYQSTWLKAAHLHSSPSAQFGVSDGKPGAQLTYDDGSAFTWVKCPHAGAVGTEKVGDKWHWVIEEGASDGHAR